MGAILDLGALIVATWMRGDDGGALEHAHPLGADQDGEYASHMGMRDRVIVQVIAHIRCLAGLDPDALTGGIGVIVPRTVHSRTRTCGIARDLDHLPTQL
jgi:hypothetical protein